MAGAPKNIDDYLKGVSAVQRAGLTKLRQQILKLLPKAEECISYAMPAFRVDGQVVAGFLATKKGCSYFPFSGTTLDSVSDGLSAYSRTKSGLHFDPQRGLPLTLLRKLIKARSAELTASGPQRPKTRGAPRKKAVKKTVRKQVPRKRLVKKSR